MAEVWVTAGAPLKDGTGWTVWYSWADGDSAAPAAIEVTPEGGRPQIVHPVLKRVNAPQELGRQIGVATVQPDGAGPGTSYAVRIPEHRAGTPLRWRTLPSGIGDGLTFLISSCFWRYGDKEGHYAATVRDLVAKHEPAFKLVMGDQLYVDWPLLNLAPGIRAAVARRYLEYWEDAVYRDALCAAPTYYACDDHEFWNNYPDVQPQLPFTWRKTWRTQTTAVTKELYAAFQSCLNPEAEDRNWYSFDVHPVSFFVADTRSERTRYKAEPNGFFTGDQWDGLERWADALEGPGVLVLPQPLFHGRGSWKDRSLGAFDDDHERLLALFEKRLTGGGDPALAHDILVLTGDIHTGRYGAAVVPAAPGERVHEFVASPASRIGGAPSPFSAPDPSANPGIIGSGARAWWIDIPQVGDTPTVDDNVGLVRIVSSGPDMVRVELELWRVRAFDRAGVLALANPFDRARPPMYQLMHREITLR
jgi:hypothetical protein